MNLTSVLQNRNRKCPKRDTETKLNESPYIYNGNLVQRKQGATVQDAYVWDRANRLLSTDDLLSINDCSYTYDGDGNRATQTTGGMTLRYLLDVQAALPVVLAETTGAITRRYLHGPTGIHAQQNHEGDWRWPLQDGLQSVRVIANNTAVVTARQYSPYGVPLNTMSETDFGFTGEMTDDNGLVYLRARYLNPAMGVFMVDARSGADRDADPHAVAHARRQPRSTVGRMPTPVPRPHILLL